ncbi:hypothetical protein ACFQU0_17790 [Hydrogenophaga defluvii]|uniref:Uncharacterized protein n=1 Tax=Hydrogenophaga defluvii TaxID=249410 RepID=A0ABW2SFV0_9BURK
MTDSRLASSGVRRAWPRKASAFIGEHHPFFPVVYGAMAAAMMLVVVSMAFDAQQQGRAGYPVVLILCVMTGVWCVWVSFSQARPLLSALDTEHLNWLHEVSFGARSKAILERRAMQAKPLRGLDLWRALVIEQSGAGPLSGLSRGSRS